MCQYACQQCNGGIRLLDSNRLEKSALICDAKTVNENRANNVISKLNRNIDKQKRIDYIANRRKEKLLFTG